MAFQIDPQHPGTVLRYFLVAETLLNSIEAYLFLFAPGYFLKLLLAGDIEVTPAHETLLQCFGILFTFGITFLTGYCALNTPTAIETRKSLYAAYALIEGVAIPFFWYLAVKGPAYSGFDPGSSKFIAQNLVLPFCGRLLALWMPDCFGRYQVVGEKKSL